MIELKNVQIIEKPFRHFIIDNFYDPNKLHSMIHQIPNLEHPDWKHHQGMKSCLNTVAKHVPEATLLYFKLHSEAFCKQLSDIFDIPDIVADRFNRGAGFHRVAPGGNLKVHLDFNYLKPEAWYRRLNCFIYLNENWNSEWDGNLELWESLKEPGASAVSYAPIFNRFICFECSESSFHGHPQPLTCPPDRARLSFAAYYYTKERPEWFREVHSTIYNR